MNELRYRRRKPAKNSRRELKTGKSCEQSSTKTRRRRTSVMNGRGNVTKSIKLPEQLERAHELRTVLSVEVFPGSLETEQKIER